MKPSNFNNKKLDQFFLKNEFILDEEVELADLNESDVVLEIGPGTGNLTRKLVKKCRVVAIEKDERFSLEGIEIIYGDALKVLKKKEIRFNKIVSNIPYSLSQKILLEILEHKWELAVLVVQKEFASKLKENTKLGLLLEDCASVDIIDTVSKEDFDPVAVDSALILIKQKKIVDKKLWSFLKKIFTSKNKNVKNVIKNCPEELGKKKIHQLTLNEIKVLYKTSHGF